MVLHVELSTHFESFVNSNGYLLILPPTALVLTRLYLACLTESDAWWAESLLMGAVLGMVLGISFFVFVWLGITLENGVCVE
ncbi:hypothetical protein BDF14DRAFT_1802327 [Spinellus fusiger]|nr:hypothetical protein BDF14DRAFT_1802327 [Spinellus fusiger]